MDIVRYSSEYETIWNEFVSKSKNGLFMFNRNYMEYHSDRFKDHSLLFYEEGDLVGLLPLNESENTLVSHGGLTFGGFITDQNMKQHRMLEMMDALRTYMAEHAFHKLIYKHVPHFYHTQPAEEDIYSLFRSNAKISKIEAATVVDLAHPIKMPKGRKAQVSRAKRENVVIEESLDYDAFIQLENDVLLEHHGARAVHTGEELALLHGRFPENIKLYVAKLDEEIIAGTVLFIYPNVVHTQYLAANDVARRIGALDYTISYVMDQYRSDKKWFDFGKSTEGDGSILNEGLISQKEGFGGRTIVYQTWEIVL